MIPKSNLSSFESLKRRDKEATLKRLIERTEITDTESREKPQSNTYNGLLRESLVLVGNPELYTRISKCSLHPERIGKTYHVTCQSPWCPGCRNQLYYRHYKKVYDRLKHGRHIRTQYEQMTPLLFTESKTKYDRTEYQNEDIRHITGVVGLCPVRTKDLQEMIQKDTIKWRRIRRRLNKTVDENYWIEAVYEIELVRWDKLRIATESDYKKLQMEMLVRKYGTRFNREPFLFVHFHGVTNLHYKRLTEVFDKEYWIGDERIPKTNPDTGLYIQRLHKDKTLEENIKKITSYPFKNPTRYKHSFIGSDYKNGEFFEGEELGRLMSVYDNLIGRQGRTVFRSLSNDAEYWWSILDHWKRQIKDSPKRFNKENRPLMMALVEAIKSTKKRGAGNSSKHFQPFLNLQNQLRQKPKSKKDPKNQTKQVLEWVSLANYLRKRTRANELDWKFTPMTLTRREKSMIRSYQARTGRFWDFISYEDLPKVYDDIKMRIIKNQDKTKWKTLLEIEKKSMGEE